MKKLIACALVALLAACGGGGGSAPAVTPPPAPKPAVDVSTLYLIQTMPPALDKRNAHFTVGGVTIMPMVVLDSMAYYDLVVYAFDASGAILGACIAGTVTLQSSPAQPPLSNYMPQAAQAIAACINPNANSNLNWAGTIKAPPASLTVDSAVAGTPTQSSSIPKLALTSDAPWATEVSWALLFLQYGVANGQVTVSWQ